MAKFTSGPWVIGAARVRENATPNGAKIWGNKSEQLVCHVPRAADRSLEQKWADLHLIAAAPELYDALTAMLEGANKSSYIARVNAYEKARAALAKADGTENTENQNGS